MNPTLVAAIARDTRAIADTLDIPHDRAENLVRWMQAHGWRLHLALADRPAAARPAPPAVAQAAIAEAKAKYGQRPEKNGASS